MIEDTMFEFLHMETVHALIGPPDAGDDSASITKLEKVGYDTGYRFVEKLTKDWQRFRDELDVMKFVCKEFWVSIFKKQIDNLRTNHQGVYVLLDSKFKFISKISDTKQFVNLMPRYLTFSCGLIRGALANLGLKAIVTSEIVMPPACRFQIHIQRPQAAVVSQQSAAVKTNVSNTNQSN